MSNFEITETEKLQAEVEWAHNFKGCRQEFKTLKSYTALRAREIRKMNKDEDIKKLTVRDIRKFAVEYIENANLRKEFNRLESYLAYKIREKR